MRAGSNRFGLRRPGIEPVSYTHLDVYKRQGQSEREGDAVAGWAMDLDRAAQNSSDQIIDNIESQAAASAAHPGREKGVEDAFLYHFRDTYPIIRVIDLDVGRPDSVSYTHLDVYKRQVLYSR